MDGCRVGYPVGNIDTFLRLPQIFSVNSLHICGTCGTQVKKSILSWKATWRFLFSINHLVNFAAKNLHYFHLCDSHTVWLSHTKYDKPKKDMYALFLNVNSSSRISDSKGSEELLS